MSQKPKTVIESNGKLSNILSEMIVKKHVPFNTQKCVVCLHSVSLLEEKDQALKSLDDLEQSSDLDFQSETDGEFNDSELSVEFDSSRFSDDRIHRIFIN